MTLRDEFKAFLEDARISQNKAAELAGYSGAVVSVWLHGDYKGNNEALENAVRSFMIRERSRRSQPVIAFQETDNSRRIINALLMTHREQEIALVVGPVGTGKTITFEHYAEQNPTAVILIKADEAMSKVILIGKIAERLGLDPRDSYADLVQRTGDTLQNRDMLVIVDEADNLSDGALELLRQVVYDKGRSSLVIAGLHRLIFRIKNLKNNHQQLASRVGVFLELGALTARDAEKIVCSVWPNLGKETMDAFIRAAGGSGRALRKLVNRSHETTVANNVSVPDPDVVKLAESLLLK
ncbi:MAG: AAA family ATPase [Treponema sp.]|jgi:DNA transposition AAA+ family ATPase|nr:AAA family ATPase [Treponema sp.]